MAHIKSTPFLNDLNNEQKTISVNSTVIPLAIYNLIISKRDITLYTKGIIPHRGFKITAVKKYFGIKGNKYELLYNFMLLYNKHYKS